MKRKKRISVRKIKEIIRLDSLNPKLASEPAGKFKFVDVKSSK